MLVPPGNWSLKSEIAAEFSTGNLLATFENFLCVLNPKYKNGDGSQCQNNRIRLIPMVVCTSPPVILPYPIPKISLSNYHVLIHKNKANTWWSNVRPNIRLRLNFR